ncbi:MAG: hypothetical protein WDN45_17750 [Caulobacteraceae bacterium]
MAVELVGKVGTRETKAGDAFALRLAAPVILDGQLAIPAGTPGLGHVVQSSGPGLGGKGAKLVVSADYLTVKGGRVPPAGPAADGRGQGQHRRRRYRQPRQLDLHAAGPGRLRRPRRRHRNPAGTAASAKVAQDLSLKPLGAATAQDYDTIRAVFGERSGQQRLARHPGSAQGPRPGGVLPRQDLLGLRPVVQCARERAGPRQAQQRRLFHRAAEAGPARIPPPPWSRSSRTT